MKTYRRKSAESIAEYDKLEDSWSKGENKYVQVIEKIPGTTTIFFAEETNELKFRSDEIGLLVEYTNFLLGEGYCDTDVYAEEPGSIDKFIAIRDKINKP